jgi:hypothetical protein
MDVFATLTKRADNLAVDLMWEICYWSTQILTWMVLPFFQVYADAGDFTVGARCMTSLKVREADYVYLYRESGNSSKAAVAPAHALL